MTAIVVIVLILLVSIYYTYQKGKSNADLSGLRGFFETNSEFNEEAGIKSFTFYIGEYCNGQYPTYLLMISNEDDKILVNNPSSLTLTSSWTVSSESDCYEFKAYLEDLNSDFMPNNMTLKFYPRSSKIILSDPNTVYGCLFKNPVLTEFDLIKDELKNKQPPKKNNSIEDIA